MNTEHNDRELPAVIWVALKDLLLNEDNPRIIKDKKFEKLVASLKKFPKMLKYRPIIVNADMIILGGNMRYSAAQEAGLSEVPVMIADDFNQAEQLEFIIKDNIGFGEWDFEELANSWDDLPLTDWGLDLPVVLSEEPLPNEDEKAKAFKLTVVAGSEEEQDEIYVRLIEMGYNVAKKS